MSFFSDYVIQTGRMAYNGENLITHLEQDVISPHDLQICKTVLKGEISVSLQKTYFHNNTLLYKIYSDKKTFPDTAPRKGYRSTASFIKRCKYP